MNELPPLPDDQRDELLSAELDGAFDAAAIDLGFDPADARSRLAATPGVDARRDALREARTRLQEPLEMDELLAARLRAKALHAARATQDEQKQHRARRLSAISGAVAAALVLVVGVAFALHSRSEPHNAKQTASAAGTPTTPVRLAAGTGASGSNAADAPIFDYGNSPSVDALVSSVRARILHTRRATEASPNSLTVGSSARSNSSFDTESPSVDKLARPATASPAVARCTPVAAQLAGSGTLASSGTATIEGQPVVVYAYEQPKSDVVVVLTADCRFLRDVVTPRA